MPKSNKAIVENMAVAVQDLQGRRDGDAQCAPNVLLMAMQWGTTLAKKGVACDPRGAPRARRPRSMPSFPPMTEMAVTQQGTICRALELG